MVENQSKVAVHLHSRNLCFVFECSAQLKLFSFPSVLFLVLTFFQSKTDCSGDIMALKTQLKSENKKLIQLFKKQETVAPSCRHVF